MESAVKSWLKVREGPDVEPRTRGAKGAWIFLCVAAVVSLIVQIFYKKQYDLTLFLNQFSNAVPSQGSIHQGNILKRNWGRVWATSVSIRRSPTTLCCFPGAHCNGPCRRVWGHTGARGQCQPPGRDRLLWEASMQTNLKAHHYSSLISICFWVSSHGLLVPWAPAPRNTECSPPSDGVRLPMGLSPPSPARTSAGIPGLITYVSPLLSQGCDTQEK